MSDDEADPELLELLRQSLGMGTKPKQDEVSSDSGVLTSAEYIYTNAIDVSISMSGTKAAALAISNAMRERSYSTQSWHAHPLHPSIDPDFSEVDMLNFIFTLDLLNFSFWSEFPEDQRFCVEYRVKLWTGYNSLVAALRRALEEGVPITTPRWWMSEECSDEVLRRVFRSARAEEMPLLKERGEFLRSTGRRLHELFGDLDGDAMNVDSTIDAPEEDLLAGQPTIDASTMEGADADRSIAPEDRPVGDGAAAATPTNTEPVEGAEGQELAPREHANSDSSSALEPECAPIGGVPATPSSNRAVTEPSQPMETGTESSAALSAYTSPTAATTETTARPDLTVVRLVESAEHSAGKLVNLLGNHFPAFLDETRFEGRKVRLMKRAQIFVADLWAALGGTGYGEFVDIDHLTMFADYRVPQMLNSLGVLAYSPPLLAKIAAKEILPAGHSWEVQLRGCSVWAVELLRREIVANDPAANENVNAVLIDFFLYDLAKEKEKAERAAGKWNL